MRLLNLGCGSNRPQDEHWTNLDNLYEQFPEGTPERKQLDSEERYIDHKLPLSLPFVENSFNGILCSHVIEHFDCHDAVRIMWDCHRVLKPGGILVVSVPDASYFLEVFDKDTKENAERLFGEPIHDDWQPNFFSYALFHAQHKQVLDRSSLRCLLLKAEFKTILHWDAVASGPFQNDYYNEAGREIEKLMNRRKFSLEMCGVK